MVSRKGNYVQRLDKENNKAHKYFYTDHLDHAKYSITLECGNYESDAFVEEKDQNSKIHPRGKQCMAASCPMEMDSTSGMLVS